LQRDGIHNLEILSPSNIEDSCSLQTNPKCPHCIEFEPIWPGMMWCIIGKKKSSPQKVHCILPRLEPVFLICLFDKVEAIRTKKKRQRHGHWHRLENRKKFLLEFAARMGFDPKVVNNWRNQAYNIKAQGVRLFRPPPPQPTFWLIIFVI